MQRWKTFWLKTKTDKFISEAESSFRSISHQKRLRASSLSDQFSPVLHSGSFQRESLKASVHIVEEEEEKKRA